MSIYYKNNNNNNNNGMYNNRNRIYSQGGQNMYPNSNYNRSQPNYPNNNNNYNNPPNYNQNYNYQQQQQNRNNQNQQNNGPKPFITVNMGRLLITSVTLEDFSKSLKSVEWTTNKNYLQASNIDVKMKQGLQGQINNINVPKNRFNEYGINSNFNYSIFSNFIREVINNNNKQKEQQEKEKISFIRNNFPLEKFDIDAKDLYLKIGQNRKDVVMKDSSLYRKVERLLPLIKPLDVPNDYKKEDDKKMLSNNNDFSLFNNNDNDNKNNNDDKKIYTNTPGY